MSRNRTLILAATIAIALSGVARAEQPAMESYPVAVLRGLDKVTARVSDIAAPAGKATKFGTLSITVRACKKRPPEEPPEVTAFLVIDEAKADGKGKRYFSGWMFASSPAISALEHPVYDVSVIDCRRSAPLTSGAKP